MECPVKSKLILLGVSAAISEHISRFIFQFSAKCVRGKERKEKDDFISHLQFQHGSMEE